MSEEAEKLQTLVAEVAAAYFANSHVSANDIPAVISQIAESLRAVGGQQSAAPAPEAEEVVEQRKLTPAQIRRSVTPEALISFEDGRPYKTLRRHLSVKGLSPEQYREKWGLPNDYPMVSPNYSAARSSMAKALGLGQKGASARGRGRKPKA